MTPEDAYELLEAIAIISDSKDKLHKLVTEKKETETQIVRKPNINFYLCGLKDGDELVCTEDPSIVAYVQGEHKVIYKNDITSLTAIMKSLKNVTTIAGPSYFTYKGEPLVDIAYRTQWKAYK